MSNKRELVDMISDATRQRSRPAAQKSAIAPEVKEERRLSNWPPGRLSQWRLENLTPWKMKPWN